VGVVSPTKSSAPEVGGPFWVRYFDFRLQSAAFVDSRSVGVAGRPPWLALSFREEGVRGGVRGSGGRRGDVHGLGEGDLCSIFEGARSRGPR
jgi:hypothetical protein